MPKTPPFRADHIGSLVRPQRLVEARRAFLAGKMKKEPLRELEDIAIRDVVRMQEDLGLQAVTDGEFRRNSYLSEFLNPLGVELQHGKSTDMLYYDDAGGTAPGTLAVVKAKLRWTGSPNVAAFTYLKLVTKAMPKVTIPAPTQVHMFAGRDGISKTAYPDEDSFWADMVAAYHAELKVLGEAGCRYVQIDETSMPKLADPAIQDVVAKRGQDWRAVLKTYADVMNRIIAGAPAGMTVAIHHCRGNNAGRWIAQAGYDAVAEMLFGAVNAKLYLLEYDTPRAGDFAPLRFVPKGKIVVLGLVTSKRGALESKDELKRRIDEASRHLPLEQLALSPQCGFASGERGNRLSADEQWAKLRLVVDVAREVWG